MNEMRKRETRRLSIPNRSLDLLDLVEVKIIMVCRVLDSLKVLCEESVESSDEMLETRRVANDRYGSGEMLHMFAIKPDAKPLHV